MKKGLFKKYSVYKVVDQNGEFKETPVSDHFKGFVLRLDEKQVDEKNLQACRIAVNAYADAIERHIPELAKDIRERWPVISPPQTETGL